MSGSMNITTSSDNAESPDAAAAAPTKPSLTTMNQAFTNLTTQEQGPLLIAFGDGQVYVPNQHLSQLGSELDSMHSAHVQANQSVMPSLHLGVPLLLSSAQAMTEPSVSQSGSSFTLLSGSTAHETVDHPGEQTALPASQHRAVLLLPRHHEFSWENSRLCFDKTPLKIVKAPEEQSSNANPTSESRFSASQASFSGIPATLSGAGESDPFSTTGIGGFCSSFHGRPTLSLPQELDVASMNSLSFINGPESNESMADDDIVEPSNPGVAIAMEKRTEWVAELLIDRFFRSYARRTSRKQTAAAKDQDLSSESGNKAQRFAGDRGRVRKPRKSRATGRIEGSGDEDEDGDGDSGGDEQGPSRAGKSSDYPYLACPFFKWHPRRFVNTCCRKFKQIRDIKYHLKGKHQEDYCPNCEMVFKETNISTHACDLERVRPRALMTKAKFKAINAIRGSEVQWKKEQQWHLIYKIIFPNEPPCWSPHFNKEADMALSEMERYFRLAETRAYIRDMMGSMGYESRVVEQFHEQLFTVIFPGVSERYAINDEGEPYMAHDKEQASQYSPPSTTVKSGTHETIISHNTGNYTSQYPHDGIAMPQSYAFTGSADHPASMSELSAGQEQSESITSDFFPDLINSEEFADPASRGLMGLCGSGSWEMLPGQNFTDPSWSAGFEVGPDLMSDS